MEGRLRPEVAIVAGERLFSQLTAELAIYNSVQDALNSFAPRPDADPAPAEAASPAQPPEPVPLTGDPTVNGQVTAEPTREETAKTP